MCIYKRLTLIIGTTLLLSNPTWSKAKELLIGLDADMSAVAAEGGIAIQRGAEIAINEINAQGGVLGHTLSLSVRDHKGNPARGVANIKYFSKKDNVVAVLGGVHTPVALKELEIIHQNNMIYLGPWAAGTPIVDNGYEPNYVFRLSVRDEHAGHVMLKHAKDRKITTVGLLLERTGWGRSNEKSMTAAAEKLGVTIADIQWFNWRQADMSAQIDKLINSGAKAILLVSNAPEGVVIANNMLAREQQNRVPIFSHWGIASGAFIKNLGADKAHELDLNVLQTFSFSSEKAGNQAQKIIDAYKKNYNPNASSENIPAAVGVAHAYDLVKILALAIENAQSTSRPAIQKALENIESYQGLSKKFAPPFTPSRHDALEHSDYIMSTFNEKGYLVPATIQ